MKNSVIRSIIAAATISMAVSTPICASGARRNPVQTSLNMQAEELQEGESVWRSLLPAVSGTPVFELDHENSKVYTISEEEKEKLIADGWEYKGPAFYSSEAENSIPVYRLYNNNLDFVYSFADSIPGYTLVGMSFRTQSSAPTWQTVTLDADRSSTVTIRSGQNVIINLNGHNILPDSGPAILVEKGGNVIVNGNGNLHAYGSEPVVRNNGNSVLNGGRYENNGNYCIINHGNMVINGGEFTHSNRDCVSSLIATGYYNFYSGNAATGYVAGENAASPMLTINGGDFHGGRWLLKSDDNGRGFINGGTFHDAKYSVIKNWSTLELLGGTFTARENGEPYGLITNGHVAEQDVDPGTLDIYGGTFCPGSYLFYPANNGDGERMVYGNITIHNMHVMNNAVLTNGTWPVSSDNNYNKIIGAENIERVMQGISEN